MTKYSHVTFSRASAFLIEMNALSAYGFASVVLMLVAYTCEHRAAAWTLIFAIGCFAAALYAWLAGTIPFAAVELVWGIIAIRKWLKRKTPTGV